MKTSDYGISLIKEFEGFVSHAYKPVPYEEYWTIGYGHYGADVNEDDVISVSDAEKLLRNDLVMYEAEVTAWNYHYRWDQNEFDAMVSFAMNCGIQNFRNLIKNGDRTKGQIAEAMLLYVHDSGDNVLEGLQKRRQRERSLFLCPVDNTPEKDYKMVDEIVDAIWNGEFGTPWSESNELYEFFQKKVNERCSNG